jgi:hypothetical protein
MQLTTRQEGQIFEMNIQPDELLASVDEAATLYARKHRRMPTTCLISLKDVPGELPRVPGLVIEASTSVLPGHMHLFSGKPGAHVTPGRGPEGRRKSNGAAWSRTGTHRWQDWFEDRQRRAPLVTRSDFTPLPGVGGLAWLAGREIREMTPLLPPPAQIAGLLPAPSHLVRDRHLARIYPRIRAEARFMNPNQNEFITRDGLVIVRPRVILLGPPQSPIPAVLPNSAAKPGKNRFPVMLGNHEISDATILVMHSAMDKRLNVNLSMGGRAGKQQHNYVVRARRENDEIVLDSRSSTKSRLSLIQWQDFADTMLVEVYAVSQNTVPMTPALEKMARDVIAFRREAPTDEAWAAEQPPTSPIPAVLPQALQSPAEVLSQPAEHMAERRRLAPAARHVPPANPFSREALLERRGIALDAVSDLVEAVEFAIEHPDNEQAQVLPGGLLLLGDDHQMRLIDPKRSRAMIVAVQLNPGEKFRFVGRKQDFHEFLKAA